MVLIFVILSFLLLLWTIFNHAFLPALRPSSFPGSPSVAILVPLRNEAGNVDGLIDSLKKVTYRHVEIILLDDQSEDGTLELLRERTRDDHRFRIVEGKGLEKGWNGKVYACHQLAGYTKSDKLFFLDADVRVSPGVIEKFLNLQHRKKTAFLSGFPSFHNTCMLGHLLVPMQHFVISFHLPLFMANLTKIPMFTAAFGGCLFMTREDYVEIGGHTKVHDSLVEDVHLAKAMKKHGKKALLVNVTSEVACKMYETNKDVWNGFRKNIFPGLGRSLVLALGVTILYITLFLVPFGLAFLAGGYWWGVVVFLIALKMYVDLRTGHPWWLSLFLPFSVIAMLIVLGSSVVTDLRSKQYEWKGRMYS